MTTFGVHFSTLQEVSEYFGGALSPQRFGQISKDKTLFSERLPDGTRRLYHLHVAQYLEQVQRLSEHDCPCWRVAFGAAGESRDKALRDRNLQLQRQVADRLYEIGQLQQEMEKQTSIAKQLADRCVRAEAVNVDLQKLIADWRPDATSVEKPWQASDGLWYSKFSDGTTRKVRVGGPLPL